MLKLKLEKVWVAVISKVLEWKFRGRYQKTPLVEETEDMLHSSIEVYEASKDGNLLGSASKFDT